MEQQLEKRWVWPFELTRELGSGAMGKVYLAKYIKNGMQLAVKFLPTEIGENPTYLARFEREMEILRNMKHPHIVRCFGGTTQGKDQFYAMELVDGGSIYSVLKQEGKIPWRRAAEYGVQMCRALEYTHKQGVIHRDIKPGNFLLTRSDQVKLGDFGLALLTAGQHLTADGKTVGTLLYMAPEQIKGDPPESAQTDLYALGCVLYEMLTGRPVFTALAAGKIIHAHLNDAPPHVKETVPEVPYEFDRLIQDLLKKSDKERPGSAEEVGDRLQEILGASEAGMETPSFGSQLLGTVPIKTLQSVTKNVSPEKMTQARRYASIATVTLGVLLTWWMLSGGGGSSDGAAWEALLKNSNADVRLAAVEALRDQNAVVPGIGPELFRLGQSDPVPHVREGANQAREAMQQRESIGSWGGGSAWGWMVMAGVWIGAGWLVLKWWRSDD